MSILPVRINTGVRRGTSGGPTSARKMIYSGTGALDKQVHLRSYPIYRYTFDFGSKTLENAEEVRSVFMVLMFGDDGPYDGFLARDWNDYELTQENSSLTFISGSDWQINRVYRVGVFTHTRPIYRPAFDGVQTIYRTRGGSVSVAIATVNTENGRAAITGHVGGDTYSAVGEFDMALTFANDEDMSRIALDGTVKGILQTFGAVELVEVLPP